MVAAGSSVMLPGIRAIRWEYMLVARGERPQSVTTTSWDAGNAQQIEIRRIANLYTEF